MDEAIQSMFRACSALTPQERKRIERAIELGKNAHEGQKRKSDGSPYFVHPLAVAEILCEWGADSDTIIAGLLHDTVEDTSITLGDIKKEFGVSVAALVEGVTKFGQLELEGKDRLHSEVETLRRLFEVMRKDIRVMLIKFADRLHNLRTIEGLPEERRATFAKESIDVYYKIAYHLGMGMVCREFTNICIPYLYPEKAKIREIHWKEQEKNVVNAVKKIEVLLQKDDKDKNILEMRIVKSSHDLPRPNKEDESADRAYYCEIITKDEDSCYEVFKMLHSHFRPVRRKFHDYIASPPESGYRSLHTTIIGPHDKQIQLRIRTKEMDEQNKRGVLRTAFGKNKKNVQEFSWLQRSAELDRTTRESSEAFWEALQSDIFQKSIEVIVNGAGVSVPLESTVLDSIYFQLGTNAHKTKSVLINGQEAELSTILNPDDVIEVIQAKESAVRHHWLDFVTTKYARNLIVEALKTFDSMERFNLGQQLLQKELDHFEKILVGEINKNQQKVIANYFERDAFEDVLVMIGEGVIQPKEIVSLLKKKGQSTEKKVHRFRLKLSVNDKHRDEIIAQISTLARLHNVNIEHVYMSPKSKHGLVIMRLRGETQSKAKYANYLAALERHSWISQLQTMMTIRQKVTLISTFFFAFVVLLFEIYLFSHWRNWSTGMPFMYLLILQLMLIAPPLVVNFYILRMLRHFVVALRNDRWFLGLCAMLNVVVCSLILYQSIVVGVFKNILPLVAVFILIMLYVGFRFIVTEQLFARAERTTVRPLTKKQWKKLLRKKLTGYTFRLGAVFIWGIQPLYLRYTPANNVDPFVRVLLTGVGVLLITCIFIFVKRIFKGKPTKKKKLPKNVLFFNIVVGYILFTYFINASLQFTTSTNFILFNNFSPVIALLIGAMLWRSSIPYLRDPRRMMWVFIIFLMGSTGAAMIIYNTIQGTSGGSLYGDFLGLLAMAADTILVVSQIRYMKLFKDVSSLAINLYVFSAHIIATVPLIIFFIFTGNASVHNLMLVPALFGIGAGVLAGIGQILNYETFRRIDGFIAFLMFNISIIITFVVEVYFLNQYKPSWILFIGGSIIIASTILAEIINSHCERKGY